MEHCSILTLHRLGSAAFLAQTNQAETAIRRVNSVTGRSSLWVNLCMSTVEIPKAQIGHVYYLECVEVVMEERGRPTMENHQRNFQASNTDGAFKGFSSTFFVSLFRRSPPQVRIHVHTHSVSSHTHTHTRTSIADDEGR